MLSFPTIKRIELIGCKYILSYSSCTLILTIFASADLWAQLSPGDLADPHAHLEGIFNCTKCHTLGEKISNQKCLDCHDLLNQRIEAGKGYHVSSDVKGKDCFECHSDHHGRDFDMIRFDKDGFDHSLTGYKLEGAHKKQDCASCHTSEHIKYPEIRKKDFTYLGLDTDCLSCHDDYHQGTLSSSCTECHGFEAFSPASNFEHSSTQFPLRGAHNEVDCASCHLPTTINGKETLKFSGIEFANCTSCHTDAHNGRLGTNCTACHTESTFNELRRKVQFDHNQTEFPLRGKHKNINCAACHTIDGPVDQVFLDYQDIDHNSCVACHEDVHDNKFGTDCRSCHDENSFKMSSTPTNFDHDLTAFELEGKHVEVDCRKCHTEELTDPLPHQQCNACHLDYHEQQFTENGQTPDCSTCHTVFGFEATIYSFEDHKNTDFPLDGAHMATPCFACHLPDEEDKWQFRDLGTECIDCHENIHKGHLEEKYYVDNSCTYCHSTMAWNDIAFEHDSTAFPLEGVHRETDCKACHFEQKGTAVKPVQTFSGLSTDCVHCHDDPHAGQFAGEHKNDCSNCHGFNVWKPSQFNHDSTAFALDGAHANLDCLACHHESVDDYGDRYIDFQIEKFECIDCHK